MESSRHGLMNMCVHSPFFWLYREYKHPLSSKVLLRRSMAQSWGEYGGKEVAQALLNLLIIMVLSIFKVWREQQSLKWNRCPLQTSEVAKGP